MICFISSLISFIVKTYQISCVFYFMISCKKMPPNNKWHQEQWSGQQQHNHLAKIKPLTAPWPSSNRSSCRLEIILTRLRIGHKRLTHSHICSHLFPLCCDHCAQDTPLSFPHIFNCPTPHNSPNPLPLYHNPYRQ